MMPHKIAMGYMLTGRHMTAHEAHQWGIVNEVVPLTDLVSTVKKWAQDILACAPISVRASKQAALMGLGYPLEVAMQMNYSEATRMRYSQDTIEGPRAFAEKRQPHWQAR
jgi:enoyl-CoA hydratase/carnithine racemase